MIVEGIMVVTQNIKYRQLDFIFNLMPDFGFYSNSGYCFFDFQIDLVLFQDSTEFKFDDF